MNDDSGSTHTVKTVPAAFPADYDMAASSEVPPKPIVFPVAQPGYQYAPQQPQTVQTVAQPRYQYAQQQPQTVQPVAQPGYQYAPQQPQTVQPVAQPGYQYAPQQPQTVQPGHQPAQYLSPQQPQTAQPVMLMVQQLPKEAPGQMMCPRCQTSVVSIIQYKRGVLSWVLCSVFAVLLLWPFFWIPLVADACKDVEHSCPICKTVLHVYKRK